MAFDVVLAVDVVEVVVEVEAEVVVVVAEFWILNDAKMISRWVACTDGNTRSVEAWEALVGEEEGVDRNVHTDEDDVVMVAVVLMDASCKDKTW